jgi:hypothetical protein
MLAPISGVTSWRKMKQLPGVFVRTPPLCRVVPHMSTSSWKALRKLQGEQQRSLDHIKEAVKRVVKTTVREAPWLTLQLSPSDLIGPLGEEGVSELDAELQALDTEIKALLTGPKE